MTHLVSPQSDWYAPLQSCLIALAFIQFCADSVQDARRESTQQWSDAASNECQTSDDGEESRWPSQTFRSEAQLPIAQKFLRQCRRGAIGRRLRYSATLPPCTSSHTVVQEIEATAWTTAASDSAGLELTRRSHSIEEGSNPPRYKTPAIELSGDGSPHKPHP